jgi:hypothetical protein
VEKQTYFITFDNASAAEANRYAEELRHIILEGPALRKTLPSRKVDKCGTVFV